MSRKLSLELSKSAVNWACSTVRSPMPEECTSIFREVPSTQCHTTTISSISHNTKTTESHITRALILWAICQITEVAIPAYNSNHKCNTEDSPGILDSRSKTCKSRSRSRTAANAAGSVWSCRSYLTLDERNLPEPFWEARDKEPRCIVLGTMTLR